MKSLPVTRNRVLLFAGAMAVSVSSSLACNQKVEFSQSAPRSATNLKPPSVAASPGPVIPGLRQGAIPQGLAYVDAPKKFLITHYFEDAASCLSVVNASSGELESYATLQDESGQPHRGHVGGVAVLEDSLFVASDQYVYQYNVADVLSENLADDSATAKPIRVTATASRKCETQASFCTATPSLLLVGEFAYGRKYPTDSSHHLDDRKGVRKYAWVCGYDKSDPMGAPVCILSVRQKVQGMCVSGDRVFLSLSYGRANRSQIVIYRNPIGEAAHRTVSLSDGSDVPLWFLDGANYLGEIDFPPMSEGIAMVGHELAVLSESGANKYLFGGKGPLDRVLLLDVHVGHTPHDGSKVP
ncbi:MAG: hypothetical protein AAGG48_31250 [Planctomycetota bacterium]